MEELAKTRKALDTWFQNKYEGEGSVTIKTFNALMAGHSAETYFVELTGAVSETVVIKTRPMGVGLLEPYRLDIQFGILSALRDTAVPTPDVKWLENDASVIGRPFYVMSMVEGEATEYRIPPALKNAAPEVIRSMCEQFVDALSSLHAIRWPDDRFSFLSELPNTLDSELVRWEAMAADEKGQLDDNLSRIVEWLRLNKPAQSAGICLLHGDSKWGNFLFKDGKMTAMLDWEIAGVGDPMLDVAYALLYWGSGPSTLEGGLSEEEFIRRYESKSGITVKNLEWYRVLVTLKLIAILVRGLRLFDRGEVNDIRYAWFGSTIPLMIQRAFNYMGCSSVSIMEHYYTPRPERVGEALISALTDEVVPALSDQPALQARVKNLLPALGFLDAKATGKDFSFLEVLARQLAD